MKSALLTLALVFSTVAVSSNGYSAQLDLHGVQNIERQYNCFSAEFSSYDSWLDFLRSKRKIKFERQGIENASEKLEEFESNFKKMFAKKDFESAKDNLECQFFTYTVGEQEVDGVLVTPKASPTHEERKPVIIYNRGGTRRYGNLVFGHVAYELFPIARQGFTIIASNYREDEQYGADNINEVTTLFKIIESIPSLRSDKVGVYGISRGALTSWQLSKEFPEKIAAIVTVNGVANGKLWAENREGIQHNISLIDGYQDDPEAVFRRVSPVRWVNQIPKAPILLIHSRDDEKVDVMHSLQLAEELTRQNRTFRMKIFEDGGHSLSAHRDEARAELIE